jgi:hypothetical protein
MIIHVSRSNATYWVAITQETEDGATEMHTNLRLTRHDADVLRRQLDQMMLDQAVEERPQDFYDVDSYHEERWLDEQDLRFAGPF